MTEKDFLGKLKSIAIMLEKDLQKTVIDIHMKYVYLKYKNYPEDLEAMFSAFFLTWKYNRFPLPAELISMIPNREGQQAMMSVDEVRQKSAEFWKEVSFDDR